MVTLRLRVINIVPSLVRKKTRTVGLLDGDKKFENMFTSFDTIHERDRRTDGQTDTVRRHRLRYARRHAAKSKR